MFESRSALGFVVHTPLGPRKSGMPDSVEMPAPVSATMRVEAETSRRASERESSRGNKHHRQRQAGNRALADDADDERAPALLHELADIRSKADARKRQQERPARQVRQIRHLALAEHAHRRKPRDDDEADDE